MFFFPIFARWTVLLYFFFPHLFFFFFFSLLIAVFLFCACITSSYDLIPFGCHRYPLVSPRVVAWHCGSRHTLYIHRVLAAALYFSFFFSPRDDPRQLVGCGTSTAAAVIPCGRMGGTYWVSSIPQGVSRCILFH